MHRGHGRLLSTGWRREDAMTTHFLVLTRRVSCNDFRYISSSSSSSSSFSYFSSFFFSSSLLLILLSSSPLTCLFLTTSPSFRSTGNHCLGLGQPAHIPLLEENLGHFCEGIWRQGRRNWYFVIRVEVQTLLQPHAMSWYGVCWKFRVQNVFSLFDVVSGCVEFSATCMTVIFCSSNLLTVF